MTTIEAKQFISNEMDLRVKLVEDVKFRELCVKMCKELEYLQASGIKTKLTFAYLSQTNSSDLMLKAEHLDNISQSKKQRGEASDKPQ
jgi:hypothetical protein